MSDKRSVKCRHYTAYPQTTCKVGLVYNDGPQPRPCYNSSPNYRCCAQFAEFTSEELDEQDRQHAEAATAYLTALDTGKCPTCGALIQKRKQIGRCAYALPCYHRLYQGKA